MAKFKFRLQKVLDVKEREEDLKKTAYAESKKKLDAEYDLLERLKLDQQNIISQKNTMMQSSLRVSELSQINSYISATSDRITEQGQHVDKAERELEKARKELLEATRERKTIEKLKHKDLEEYMHELKREEEKMLDQFVSYSSSKNTSEE